MVLYQFFNVNMPEFYGTIPPFYVVMPDFYGTIPTFMLLCQNFMVLYQFFNVNMPEVCGTIPAFSGNEQKHKINVNNDCKRRESKANSLESEAGVPKFR